MIPRSAAKSREAVHHLESIANNLVGYVTRRSCAAFVVFSSLATMRKEAETMLESDRFLLRIIHAYAFMIWRIRSSQYYFYIL